MNLDIIVQLLQSAVCFGTVIMYGAMGEILTEKTGNLNLGVPGYEALEFKADSATVLEGQGWITITAENVDSFGF